MLLAKKLKIEVTEEQCCYFSHMCYAASKLWNLCNYEKYNWKELGLEEFPNWYYQKKKWKNNFWYKMLPSQTAQEVCKSLDQSWKSYTSLKKTGGIRNPQPPNNKKIPMPITYMQNGMKHNEEEIRLSLPITLKQMVKKVDGFDETFLFLRHKAFSQVSNIKQLMILPPQNGKCDVVLNYEVKEAVALPDNGKYLAIDLGIHNLATCFDSANDKTFIVGREYLAICHYFHKEIAKAQSALSRNSQSSNTLSTKILDGRCNSTESRYLAKRSYSQGKFPQYTSKRLKALRKKRNNSIRDYLHKLTKFIVNYCIKNEINTVVVGDLKGLAKNKKRSHHSKSYNQKLYEMPYFKISAMLEYKLTLEGINFVLQEESYSSQCSPNTPEVSKQYAQKSNRIQRGLYIEGNQIYNADAVGAFNILRKYCSSKGIKQQFSTKGLQNTEIIKLK